MLVIHVARIPPDDGQDIDAVLDPGQVHLEGEQSFELLEGRLKVHLDKGEENTVQVKGRLAARLQLECGRCLEPFTFKIDQDVDLFYLPRHKEAQAEEQDADVQLSDHQMIVVFYDEDRLDLGEMVREQFYLQIPMRRLCKDDCKGICPDCGKNRNLERCDCAPVGATDPRLARLGRLFDKQS